MHIPNILGESVAVPGKEHKFVIKTHAVEGQTYLFHCPECGTYGSQKADKADVLLSWDCPKCAAKVYFKARKETTEPSESTESSESTETTAPPKTTEIPATPEPPKKKKKTHPFKSASDPNSAVLTWGSFLSRGKHILAPGEHFIGRKDPASVSAVMINDKYASTRSVSIDVLPIDEQNSGFLYKMTVHKATNPVYHNNKEMSVGSSIYLEYGDIIILGKTKFTFNKGK